MKRLIQTILILSILAISYFADARPQKGFHTGPYLTLELGLMQTDYDRDMANNEKLSRDFEPEFGFLFGWNLTDAISTELQGRYATNLKSDRRLHIGSANVYGRYTFIFDALTDFSSLRILPFLKVGMAVRTSVLPGNRNADSNTATQLGWGPSPGGGISFLWKKYFYFGIDVQGDLLIFDEVRQNVGGVPNTLVYQGGFHPSFCGSLMVGVHY